MNLNIINSIKNFYTLNIELEKSKHNNLNILNYGFTCHCISWLKPNLSCSWIEATKLILSQITALLQFYFFHLIPWQVTRNQLSEKQVNGMKHPLRTCIRANYSRCVKKLSPLLTLCRKCKNLVRQMPQLP